jgi:clan AA aspartic protease
VITGRVTEQNEAVITIMVRGEGKRSITLEAVLDTGFDGCLCLSPDDVSALRLPFIGKEVVILADGSDTELHVYQASVEWHGRLVRVPVIEAEGGALIGMALLRGSHVGLDVIEDGHVRVEPLLSA